MAAEKEEEKKRKLTREMLQLWVLHEKKKFSY
jgi:hypothetical protein